MHDQSFQQSSNPSDLFIVGRESYFNEDARFFKDVYVYGKLYYDFPSGDNISVSGDLAVSGISSFYGRVSFYDSVYIAGDLDAGIITARKRLDVGVGGTVLRADTETGRVGIGITDPRKELDVIGSAVVSEKVGIGVADPQQKLDVAGSVKIDENIYDSSNSPAKNGYFLTRDDLGIRWLPLVAESRTDNGISTALGIATDGIFVLNEMIPLHP